MPLRRLNAFAAAAAAAAAAAKGAEVGRLSKLAAAIANEDRVNAMMVINFSSLIKGGKVEEKNNKVT